MNEPNEPKTITGHIAFDVAIIIMGLLFAMSATAAYLENKNKNKIIK
jgi:hypothetical protein